MSPDLPVAPSNYEKKRSTARTTEEGSGVCTTISLSLQRDTSQLLRSPPVHVWSLIHAAQACT